MDKIEVMNFHSCCVNNITKKHQEFTSLVKFKFLPKWSKVCLLFIVEVEVNGKPGCCDLGRGSKSRQQVLCEAVAATQFWTSGAAVLLPVLCGMPTEVSCVCLGRISTRHYLTNLNLMK